MLLPSVHVNCSRTASLIIHLVSINAAGTTTFSECANCERTIAQCNSAHAIIVCSYTAKCIFSVCIGSLYISLLTTHTGFPIEHINGPGAGATVVRLIPIDARGAAVFILGAHGKRIAL